jgi:hypothetical protein
MRNTLILLSLAAVVAACSDQPQPTSPLARRSVNGQAAGSVSPIGALVSAQGKPTDQVGFTKVTEVTGDNLVIQPGQVRTVSATCPAGSTLIGGGHRVLTHLTGTAPPWILAAEDDGQNGWLVTISNEQPGASTVNYRATAFCVS